MTAGRRQSLFKRVESWAFHAYWNRISAMSLDEASNAGARFARTLGPITSAHKTARYNMRLAFPRITPQEEREMLDAMWDNLGRVVGEFPHLASMGLFTPESRADFDGLDILDRYVGTGQAGVFISGHFANWEVMPAAIVRRGVDCRVTYRPANNIWVDDTIVQARADYGVRLFAPKGPSGGVSLMRILAKGGSVAMMNDQKYETGVEAPFFGHMCKTADGPSRLAYRFKAPLQTMTVKRLGGVKFKVEVQEPMMMDFDASVDDAVHASVLRINRFMEETILKAPEQWFWVHARWPKKAWMDAGVMD
ncbi:lipid A biosynthesis palmitoleoyltransferase [Candidatus Phycosocius bacilliformis]|uniref:Lipid A biosynthesis palmitoleoyltransferase n=1 Tax=Candidatus Phycosocius bacilliformis TaxID=1445552 RepID=A0A2P2E8M0_9PROT|nr:lysophospholipid acyltransferase family protein [Candidatus Phycosocius bacilliformis]GBF57416.1 lipid A biosynthesis palmitoleoyltransferase [Candidatus Phycosocius bacilliformis]